MHISIDVMKPLPLKQVLKYCVELGSENSAPCNIKYSQTLSAVSLCIFTPTRRYVQAKFTVLDMLVKSGVMLLSWYWRKQKC